jgi:hypothetical protein
MAYALVLCAAAPRPTATPAPAPRLRLDIDAHAQRLADAHALPRFSTSIDVVGRAPQDLLEDHFRGFDVECGPASGAPTEVEMRELRHHAPPYLDWLAVARLVATALKKRGPDRFFLYRVRKADGDSYVLLETRLPADALYKPGATFELLDAFDERKPAVRAWRARERGEAVAPASDATPPPPWVTTTCRP